MSAELDRFDEMEWEQYLKERQEREKREVLVVIACAVFVALGVLCMVIAPGGWW